MRPALVFAFLALSIEIASPQDARSVAQGQLAPYETITTPPINVGKDEAIAVDVFATAGGRRQASVSAFDSKFLLMEKQGAEDLAQPVPFRWTPADSGIYHLQIRNQTDDDVSYTVLLISGQTSRAQPEKTGAAVRVFFGTNRKPDKKSNWKPGEIINFGSEPDPGQLHYGVFNVGIPLDHKLGELESSPVIRLFQWGQDPKEVAVTHREYQNVPEVFFNDIKRSVLPSKKKSALVFVHGFNVRFEDAVRRAGQIAFDLHYDTPIVFSWPSAGEASLGYYNRDGDMSELSVPAFEEFLAQIQQQSGADNLQIIAHSMGNRVLLRTLERMALRKGNGKRIPRISEVVFMAPDIEAEVFRAQFSAVKDVGPRFTLYTSDNDHALQLSRELHKGRRAGQGGAGTLVLKGIDSIDASKVNTDFFALRHSYFADSASIIHDLDQLLQGRPVSQRVGLREVSNRNGVHWEFLATAH